MSNSLILSFLVSDVCESLRSLTKHEWPWAICSGRSEEMSDRELITQVAHQKSLIFFSKSRIRSFLDKIREIRSENRWEFPALHTTRSTPNTNKEDNTIGWFYPKTL